MPDIFIPMDTTGITRYYTEVWGRNILYRYTLDFCDRHRERINSVRSIDDLNRLLAGSNLMSDFIAYARARGVEPDYRDIAASHKLIEAQIRAYIGRNTPLEDNGFYANIYPIDNVIKSAVEELSDAEGTRVDQQYNRTEQ